MIDIDIDIDIDIEIDIDIDIDIDPDDDDDDDDDDDEDGDDDDDDDDGDVHGGVHVSKHDDTSCFPKSRWDFQVHPQWLQEMGKTDSTGTRNSKPPET